MKKGGDQVSNKGLGWKGSASGFRVQGLKAVLIQGLGFRV